VAVVILAVGFISAIDQARFGLLFLRKGKWKTSSISGLMLLINLQVLMKIIYVVDK
jgi:hypothetical protein